MSLTHSLPGLILDDIIQDILSLQCRVARATTSLLPPPPPLQPKSPSPRMTLAIISKSNKGVVVGVQVDVPGLHGRNIAG